MTMIPFDPIKYFANQNGYKLITRAGYIVKSATQEVGCIKAVHESGRVVNHYSADGKSMEGELYDLFMIPN